MHCAGAKTADTPGTMAKRTPQEVLRRILRMSALNGWSVALFSGFCALISLLFGQLTGTGVGVMIMIGGIMELRGRKKLQRHDIDGMRLLVRAQLFVLGVVLVYAVSRVASFDAEFARSNVSPEMQQLLTESGVDLGEILPLIKLAFYGMYGAVILATILYQGGMAWYYHRRTAAVRIALTAPPVVPAGRESQG
jgi:hypothetical protein